MINYIKELVNKLNYYTKKYDEGHPEISDEQWDKLYFELQEKEKETGLILSNSPTQRISYTVKNELTKIKHEHLMLSLDKTKDKEAVARFIGDKDYIAMFKLDGLTCSLTYENGKLVRAETRGNGVIGEDILHNAKVIPSIPLEIPYKDRLVVDGEIICCKKDFEKFKNEYKNSRNFAAGSIRLLSSEECARRNLTFVVWEVIDGLNEFKSLSEKLNYLQQMAFVIVPYVCQSDVDNVLNAFSALKEDAANDLFPIDGYVFKFNDIKYGKSLGQTEHHFKNAIAFKMYDELYDTTLKNIDWTMGRTGVLSPIAVFEPININGAIIERASLHNVSVMTELLGDKPFFGQSLKVFRANLIIPQIAEADKSSSNSIRINLNAHPKKCPICGGSVEYRTSSEKVVNAYCSNPNCNGKLINILDHYCGKKGLDIKGLSKATFEKLIDWNWVNKKEDIYYLSNYRKEWISKPGFGVASVDKILKSIEASKKTNLQSFLSAIGIPLIGQTAAKELAKHFDTYADFKKAVDDKNYYFFSLPGFGEEMNDSLKHFDYTEADSIQKLLQIEKKDNLFTNNDKKLSGEVICITGKLQLFKNRNELKQLIESYGGKVGSSITSKTTMLINNDASSQSTKNLTAIEKGILIITETDFMNRFVEK